MEVFTLLGSMGLEGADEVEEELSDVDSQAEETGSTFEGLGSKLASFGATAGKIAGGALAGLSGAIATVTTKAGNYADQILDMSAATGMATDTLQEYRAQARMAGVNSDALTNAMRRLIRELSRGEEGSARMRRALKKLPLTMEELKQATPAEALKMMLDTLRNLDDEQKRVRVGMMLFNRKWEDLAPLVNTSNEQLSEWNEMARDMGFVVDKEGLKALNDLRQAFEKIKIGLIGFSRDVADTVQPVITDLLENLAKAIRNNRDKVKSFLEDIKPRLKKWYDRLKEIAKNTWQAIKDGGEWIINNSDDIVESLGEVGEALKGIKTMLAAIVPMMREYKKMFGSEDNTGNWYTGITGGKKEAERRIKALHEELDAAGALTDQEVLLTEELAKKKEQYYFLLEAYKDNYDQYPEFIEKEEEMADKVEEDSEKVDDLSESLSTNELLVESWINKYDDAEDKIEGVGSSIDSLSQDMEGQHVIDFDFTVSGVSDEELESLREKADRRYGLPEQLTEEELPRGATEGATQREVEFDQRKYRKYIDVVQDLDSQLRLLEDREELGFIDDAQAQKAKATKRAIVDLLRKGLDPSSQYVQKLVKDYKQLKQGMDETTKSVREQMRVMKAKHEFDAISTQEYVQWLNKRIEEEKKWTDTYIALVRERNRWREKEEKSEKKNLSTTEQILAGINEETKSITEEMKGHWKDFGSTLVSSTSDLLYNMMTDFENFGDHLRNFFNTLSQAILRQWANQLATNLWSSVGNMAGSGGVGGGGGSGWIGTALSLGAQVFSMQSGGKVTGETLATLGEQGQEEVVLPLDQNVFSNLANEITGAMDKTLGAGGSEVGEVHVYQVEGMNDKAFVDGVQRNPEAIKGQIMDSISNNEELRSLLRRSL